MLVCALALAPAAPARTVAGARLANRLAGGSHDDVLSGGRAQDLLRGGGGCGQHGQHSQPAPEPAVNHKVRT